jgi:hypothetical protein
MKTLYEPSTPKPIFPLLHISASLLHAGRYPIGFVLCIKSTAIRGCLTKAFTMALASHSIVELAALHPSRHCRFAIYGLLDVPTAEARTISFLARRLLGHRTPEHGSSHQFSIALLLRLIN